MVAEHGRPLGEGPGQTGRDLGKRQSPGGGDQFPNPQASEDYPRRYSRLTTARRVWENEGPRVRRDRHCIRVGRLSAVDPASIEAPDRVYPSPISRSRIAIPVTQVRHQNSASSSSQSSGGNTQGEPDAAPSVGTQAQRRVRRG